MSPASTSRKSVAQKPSSKKLPPQPDFSSGAIAVMTSGGDAPGMNACLRGVVRYGNLKGLDVYAIMEGYQGLIEDDIQLFNWDSVSGIIGMGGTVIGTARSKAFRTEEGLLQAVENLVKRGINKMVVCGGDGSLSGAEELRREWPNLCATLLSRKRITKAQAESCPTLTVVGTVGSIDNDMADTDMTIGADSALHRIVEAVNAIVSTAFSHRRTFIIEVMGRNSGYLALMSALATGATACYIPEVLPETNWGVVLADRIRNGRNAGRRVNIVIVAEGAKDSQGNPLHAVDIQSALAKTPDIEARVTILGHVQRGGAPSAFDRYTSTVFGVRAVEALLENHNESQLVNMRNNRIGLTSLTEAVRKTRETAKAVAAGQNELAGELRGAEWQQMVQIYRTLSLSLPEHVSEKNRRRIGLISIGHAAPGMNGALRTALRIGFENGADFFGIEEGPTGLIENKIRSCTWQEVESWSNYGGSRLGAGRRVITGEDLPKIAANIRKWKLDGLIMVGDRFGYSMLDFLIENRKGYREFNIPMIAVPASINNDLPGSEYSIGTDTALNTIVEAVDKIKDSTDTAKRAYVVEVMGNQSGYLAVMAGLATGAEYIYIPELGISLDKLRHDIRELTGAFKKENRHTGLIIRSRDSDPIYSTNLVADLFEADGGDAFDVRKAILGPIQQGGAPTPYDRIEAVRLGYSAIMTLLATIDAQSSKCSFLGRVSGGVKVYDWSEYSTLAAPESGNFQLRWWNYLHEMIRTLAIRPDLLLNEK